MNSEAAAQYYVFWKNQILVVTNRGPKINQFEVLSVMITINMTEKTEEVNSFFREEFKPHEENTVLDLRCEWYVGNVVLSKQ